MLLVQGCLLSEDGEGSQKQGAEEGRKSISSTSLTTYILCDIGKMLNFSAHFSSVRHNLWKQNDGIHVYT